MSRLIAAVIILLLFVSFAAAKARVALVIGNSSYQHVPELPNPKNDAATVAAKLKSIGFEVIEGRDLTLVELRRSVRDFIDQLSGAELGLFYYAGHGLQVNGRNYLAPVDARLETYDDLDFEAFPIDLVLSAMERKTKTNLVFLDACRNNPLARNLARSMGTRSTDVGRGLARISSGVGTLISFSTQPGNVALDGSGRNSPFTSALVKHIGTPGEDISHSMREVRNDVLNVTDGKQVPWENSSLTGDVILVGRPVSAQSQGQPVKPAHQPTSGGDASTQVEIAYWNSIKDAERKAFFQSYLVRYPAGLFADIAKLKIADFEKVQAAAEKQTTLQGALATDAADSADGETKVAALTPAMPPDYPFDGRWRVTVHSRSGCLDNDDRSYPITVAQGQIDEPHHQLPKKGTVSEDGAFRIEVASRGGRPMNIQEGTISGDKGQGRFVGAKPSCIGSVVVERVN